MSDTHTLFAAALATEISRARQDPAAYAQLIASRLSLFKGKDYYPPERQGATTAVAVPTKEGLAGVRDAVKDLQSQVPLGEIVAESGRGLGLAATDHAHDRGTLGAVGHCGADGSRAVDRVGRYGQLRGKTAECLWFGREGTSARAVVADLLIDDGVPDRGHRRALLDPAMRIVGSFCGPHRTFGMCVAIELAEGYSDDLVAVRRRGDAGPPEPTHVGQRVRTQWNLGSCPTCGQPVQGGSVIEAVGGAFHMPCFTCHSCGLGLAGGAYHADGRLPLCPACHTLKFGRVCTGCEKKLSKGLLLDGRPWCSKDCFASNGVGTAGPPGKTAAGPGRGALAGAARGTGAGGRAASRGAGGRAGAAGAAVGRTSRAQTTSGGGRGRAGPSVWAARAAVAGLALDYASLG